MLAFPQAMQPTLSHLGPQWNAALSTHHRIAWLARESSKPGRDADRALDPAGQRRLVARAPATTTRRGCRPSCCKAFAESHRHPRRAGACAQLRCWRDAKTETPLGQSHLWDARAGIGIAGDWCIGHRVEDAFVSGLLAWRSKRPDPDVSYVGRFAPSPTGPLHAGSLVAALASWLDARAHGGRWLVRIEDVDTERCVDGMAGRILRQLADCALHPDATPVRQSQRTRSYEGALDRLTAAGLAYPCGCSRKDIDTALAHAGEPRTRHAERVYPGTCRDGLHGKAPRAWRFAVWKFDEICRSARCTGAISYQFDSRQRGPLA